MKDVIYVENHYFVTVKENSIKFRNVIDKSEKFYLFEEIEAIIFDHYKSYFSYKLVIKCIENNIAIIFCDKKHSPLTQLISSYGMTHRLQRIQSQFQLSGRTRDRIWKKIVVNKIINKSKFENLSLDIPSLKNQKKISNILSVLDNKIEINKKIIANLEELSQTLFKRWFVDFEFPDENGNPYKSSGGEMIDSELGEIPDGWNVKNLKDIAFCQNGYAFYKLGYSNSGYFAVDLGNININSQFVYTNKDKFISKDIIDEKKEKFILNKNDLVMVMTDRTQEMNILGRTARIPKSNKYVLNQRIFRLRAKNKHILTYLQAMLNSVEIRNQLKMKSLGSAQKYINTKHITELSIKCPDNELIKNFYRSCENYFIKSEMLNEEIEKLTQLRDTLLPKLMSGEIEIPDDIEVNEDELSI